MSKLYYEENKDERKKYAREYRKNNPEKYREGRIKHLYGITLIDYENIFKNQNGLCCICEQKSSSNLYVDHNHKTGKVRGLLCNRCNLALGFLDDNVAFLKRAVKYLERE